MLGVHPVEIDLKYDSKVFDLISKIAWHHEKPFPLLGNAIAMHQMYAEIGKTNVKVLLDGTGGDEVACGYWNRYAKFIIIDAIKQGKLKWINDLMAATQKNKEKYIAICLWRTGTSKVMLMRQKK